MRCPPPPRAGAKVGLTRRRVLTLCAFAAAVPRRTSASGPALTRWQGQAFGADVAICIEDDDRESTRRAIADAVAEIRQLEQALSLYLPDSALVRLNASGSLAQPPQALRDVLAAAMRVSAISDGAFDVTVQPLWDAHMRAARDTTDFERAIEAARARVGWRNVRLEPHCVSFGQPDMAVTLNGIAQGYAADRVALRLRSHGLRHVLADVGEYRAVGGHAWGHPWRLGIESPVPARSLQPIADVVELEDRGLATSSPFGTPLNRDASRHHLFDPRTGRSSASWASVSVIAATAMLADALSTAIAVSPADRAADILTAGGGIAAVLIDFRGAVQHVRG